MGDSGPAGEVDFLDLGLDLGSTSGSGSQESIRRFHAYVARSRRFRALCGLSVTIHDFLGETMSSMIRENLERIRERIAQAALRSGRRPEDVKLVGVTKTVPADRITEAVDAGVAILGENYVQEAQKKREGVSREVRWHMIGHLQSNKAKLAVSLFDVFETVDREKILRTLQTHASQQGKNIDVLIQVNLYGEASKAGVSPDLVLSLVKHTTDCNNLCCRGLMTIPPFFDEPEKARPAFSALRRLRDEIQPLCPSGVVLEELSMGMSGDFEAAIEEGATLVRIGTALFGRRAP